MEGIAKSAHANPVIESAATWVIYPYLLEEIEVSAATDVQQQGLGDRIRALQPPKSWKESGPEELVARNLDRWFVQEVRALFRTIPGESSAEICARSEHRFRWFGPIEQEVDREGATPFFLGNAELGLMRSTNRGVVIELIPRARINFWTMLSRCGVLLVIVRIQLTDVLLSTAMRVNYLCAHCDEAKDAALIVPHATASSLRRRNYELGDKGREQSFFATPQQARECRSLWEQHTSTSFSDESIRPGLSLPMSIRDAFAKEIGKCRAYSGFRGRMPLVSHLRFSDTWNGEAGSSLDFSLPDFKILEGLIARCMPHPIESPISPTLIEWLVSEEFEEIRLSETRKFYVSSEAAVALTITKTEFERSQWGQKIAGEYLCTYLIALHQLLVAQDLSWRSCRRNPRTRDNELLLELFRDFSTEYDFAVVSNQMSIQRFYRVARRVLGVERIVPQLREELSDWLGSELRKEERQLNKQQKLLNEEQRRLNSLAVVALFVNAAFFFLDLNVREFNSSAPVSLFPWKVAFEGPLWLWVPLLFVVMVFLANPKMRTHWMRLIRLLFGHE